MPRISGPPETAEIFERAFGRSPVLVSDALAIGLSRSQLRAAMSRGLLVAPRRGVLAVAPKDAGQPVGGLSPTADAPVVLEEPRRGVADVRDVHVRDTLAALRAVAEGAIATHDSAATLLGLARPSPRPPGPVTLARPGVQDFDGPRLRLRGTEIPRAFVVRVDGVLTTDVRRTAVDLARGLGLAQALIPLDAAARALVAARTQLDGNALRRAVLAPELRAYAARELAYAAASCRKHPGIVAVRNALPYVDPAAESPLESRSRGWFLHAGLTSLRIGVPVSAGASVYWADFYDDERQVVGEADGWSKYGDDVEEIRRSWAAEKRRQAALESAGMRVVRWTSEDTRATVTARMRTALRRD